MPAFFTDTKGQIGFTLFGPLHLLISIIPIMAILFIYHYRDQLKHWCFHEQMRYVIAFIMFLNMTIYYLLKIVDHTWDFRVHLPLHFCFISGYMFMYALLTNRKQMFRYLYFFSFAGPLPAIIFPDLTCGFDRFLFWQYFISHHFFITASFYCIFVLDWKVERKDIFPAIAKANMIFFLVFCFNQIFHTNYIMTATLPEHIIHLMPFLSNINFPIILLELVGLLSTFTAYLLIAHFNKQTLFLQ